MELLMLEEYVDMMLAGTVDVLDRAMDADGLREKAIENLEILCPTCHLEDHFMARDGIFWNNRAHDLTG